MNRRKLIVGAGTIAVGSTAALGTGAFTSAQAQRNIAVSIAQDASAFLGFDPDVNEYDNSPYATESDGLIQVDITGGTDRFDGEGVSPGATTTIEEVFPIENRGTQTVTVSVTSPDLSADDPLDVFATPDPRSDDTFSRTSLLDGTDLPEIESGGAVAFGLEVDTEYESIDTFLEGGIELIIQAEEVDS